MRCRGWSILALILVASSAAAEPEKWGRFRGPNGAGTSNATTVPVRWTGEDYNWRVPLPGVGHSSPVVWNDRVYVTTADADGAGRSVVCLSTGDGSTLWRRDDPAGPYRQHRHNGYATATPAVDEHGVVVTWTTPSEIVLVALAHDGSETWRRDLGPFVGPHGTGTSPVIVDGLVVLGNDQEDFKVLNRLMGRDPVGPAGESFLIAVDRNSGETRWKIPRKSMLAAYSTPCIHRPGDGPAELIFTSTAHGVTAVDVGSGKVNWQIEDIFEDRCVGSPLVAKGLVIAAYGHGATGRLLVAAHPGSPGKEPTIAYEIRQSVPLVPTPLVVGSRLYLWADAGIVTCLDVATGKVIWRERVGGSYYGSPVCVGGQIYCVARDGEVVVIAASDTFEELARVPLGEPSFSTPAVADGVMYLRTATHLYSLGGNR